MEKQTLAERTAERLTAMIRARNYGPGDRLPTEQELMEQLTVGRNTLREALRFLVSRNMVVIRQGAGTFVSEKQGVADDPLGFGMVGDQRKLTRDLLAARVILEPQIAALAAQNAEEEDIQRLEEVLLQLETRMRRREWYAELDSAFHTAVAECTHNQVMARLIPVIADGVRSFAESVEHAEYEETLRSHRRIFEAIRTHRAVEAQAEMQYHLLFNQKRYGGL